MANELQIKKFNHGFGISKLSINNSSNSINNSLYNNLIYAANGLFKTSFSKTMHNLSNGLLVEDRISNQPFEYEMYIDGIDVNSVNLKEKIIVFTKDLMDDVKIGDLNNEFRKLAVVDELMSKIKIIYDVIDKTVTDLSQLVESLGYDSVLLNLLSNTNPERKFEYLKSALNQILNVKIIEENDIIIQKKYFSSEVYEKIDNSKVREQVNEIIEYTKNIQMETIFDDGFTVFAASEFLKSLKQNSFFSQEKQRGIILKEKKYYSYEEFEQDLNEQISIILNTPESKSKIDGIFKAIGNKKKEEKQLRKDILKNNNLIETLRYPRSQWIASELMIKYSAEIHKMSEFIKLQENELEDISKTAETFQSDFERAIDIYEDRFNPVFKVMIVNRINTILGIELPIFEFTHKSKNDYRINEEKLTSVLSSGENTTFNVLKFIVMYERLKENHPLVILDDVVDSFDYGNRYAFIEYIKDMTETDNSNVIVLTNNYDFFRNLKLRSNKLTPLATTIKQNGTIVIANDRKLSFNTNDIFNIDSTEKLIVSLPFAREIATYHNNESAFVQYFHLKRGSKRKTIGGICKLIQKHHKNASITNVDKNAKYMDTLDQLCRTIVNGPLKSFDISPKVILALGIRMKLEKILIRNRITIIDSITTNQTAALLNLKKSKLKIDFIRLASKIMVSTPEFIHVNAFMYEPLIDILPIDLKKMYEKLLVFENDASKVWKK